MSVTAEQWAQAEAERQRQADMVQTLINEVRRLGTEQNNNLQEIQRLRAEQFLPTPPVEPSEGEGPPPPAPPAGRESSTRESGSRLCFQVTRTRGATGVSSCAPTFQWSTSNLAK